jgi:hypothetical protein
MSDSETLRQRCEAVAPSLGGLGIHVVTALFLEGEGTPRALLTAELGPLALDAVDWTDVGDEIEEDLTFEEIRRRMRGSDDDAG